MDPHNPRRTIRALEVIEVTGRPYSASLPHYRYVIPTVQIGLDLPREELDRRIDIRTKQMLEDGFIEEVERMRPHLGASPPYVRSVISRSSTIWTACCDLNDTFMDIAQKTKRLARKQMGWFGRDPRIHWLQALNPRSWLRQRDGHHRACRRRRLTPDAIRRASGRIHPASSRATSRVK